MFKKLFIYVALMMSFAACSDDIFDAPDSELVPADGNISIKLAVPEMTRVGTRADYEYDIKDMYVLVFDDDKLQQIESVTPDQITGTRTYKFDFTVDEDLRRKSGLEFVVLANSGRAKSSFTIGTALSSFRDQYTNGSLQNADGYLMMSGTSSLQELLKFTPIPVYHNAAKVSVAVAQLNADKSVKLDTDGKTILTTGETYPFVVYGTAVNSALFAGAYTKPASSEDVSRWNKPVSEGDKYVHPSFNTGTYNSNCYVILQVPYQQKQYYYRVDFRTGSTYIDLLPNHHYEFVIKGEPVGPGFDTMEEAAASPTPEDNTWVEIHDHAPLIYNMVTDGQHELGVSHDIIYTGGVGGTTTFNVKVYSKEDSNQQNELASRNNWSKIFSLPGFVEIQSVDKLTGSNLAITGDATDSGTVYMVTIKFTETGTVGTQKSEIRVAWQGLVREIPLTWDREFDPSKLVKSAKLTMSGADLNDDPDRIQTQYFTFVKNSVYGTSAAANNNIARNEGFHFPLQYGEGTNLASYTYEVVLNDLMDGAAEYDYTIYVDGALSDEAALNYIRLHDINASSSDEGTTTINGSCEKNQSPSFKITCKPDGWDYFVGKITIGYKLKSASEYTFNQLDFYHTGFFHKDCTSAKKGNDPNVSRSGTALYAGENVPDGSKYTYYEVVSMGNNHWLDRNLGAHSAGYYVMTNKGETFTGDPDAAGIYYRVAEYNDPSDNNRDFPIMRAGICPPGYDYPSEYDFDGLKQSAAFHTDAVGNYYDASYVAVAKTSTNPGKTVYFPRVGYYAPKSTTEGTAGYNVDEIASESRAGYYWTKNGALGMEKEEYGAWNRAFSLAGNSGTYINAAVYSTGYNNYTVATVKRGNNGYAMPVRCVAKRNTSDPNQSEPTHQSINFSVTGATHVFLYKGSGDNLTAVQPWPGIQLCDYMNASKKFNLNYTSQTFSPDEVKVIFNFKDEQGIIHSFSKDADGISGKHSTKFGPKDLEGWAVNGGSKGVAYKGSLSNSKISKTTDKLSSKLGCSWLIGYNGQTPGTMSGSTACVLLQDGDPYTGPQKTKYRVYWAWTQSWNALFLYNNNYPAAGQQWIAVNESYSCVGDKQTGIGSFHNKTVEGKRYAYFEFEVENIPSTLYWGKNESGGEFNHFSSTLFKKDADGVLSVLLDFPNKTQAAGGPIESKFTYRIYWPYDATDFKGINSWWYGESSSLVNDATWNGTQDNYIPWNDDGETSRSTFGKFRKDGSYTFFEFTLDSQIYKSIVLQQRKGDKSYYENDKPAVSTIAWKSLGGNTFAITFNGKDKVISGMPVLPNLDSGKKRIYFYNAGNWANPSMHSWNSSENSGSNPIQMKKVENASDSKWYYLDIDSKYTNIQFRAEPNFSSDQAGDYQISNGSKDGNDNIRYFSNSGAYTGRPEHK